ncbi:DL-endopeptidase inhibitor IseA family protein [Brevibacillus laterosporus]|uniref:DL-endopeptidase inhibitor IseA family protein n=1 Tax=Brevibacillus laterosporus TaxID=1465 RepID=UPI002E21A8B8|nr:DL-endopeptidase inhibitor IseA family protein [Brevibacillus laterosporus]
MKKWTGFLLLSALVVALAGCTGNQPDQKPTTPTTETAQPATEITKPAGSKHINMDEKEAVALAAEGADAYAYVLNGGKIEPDKSKSFTHEGKDYRFVGSDIDTKEKLMKYLENVYTKTASDIVVNNLKLIEKDGKLAQPSIDKSSVLQWGSGQAEMITENQNGREYEIKVPIGEGDQVDFKVYSVRIKQEDGVWKLDTIPGVKE